MTINQLQQAVILARMSGCRSHRPRRHKGPDRPLRQRGLLSLRQAGTRHRPAIGPERSGRPAQAAAGPVAGNGPRIFR
jgi:hypothetical protein